MEERTPAERQRQERRQRRRERRQGTPESVGRAARQDTLQLGADNVEESVENEEDLQAWCPLEESENEQWQEVISKQNK